MMGALNDMGNFLVTIVASVLLILLGVIYFMLTTWMIKAGAMWAGYPSIDGGTVVMTAGIITAAAIIGSAIQQ